MQSIKQYFFKIKLHVEYSQSPDEEYPFLPHFTTQYKNPLLFSRQSLTTDSIIQQNTSYGTGYESHRTPFPASLHFPGAICKN